MVKILKQPRWAFWKYEETYEFTAPPPSTDLIERIASFYAPQRIRNLVREPMSVRFSRGSVIGSLFSPIERHHKQDVTISLTHRDDGTAVVCQHLCWDPYPNFHTEPRMLRREVQRLADFVSIGTSLNELTTTI